MISKSIGEKGERKLKKIYVSGCITNDKENYIENFAKVVSKLEKEGWEVIDPSKLDFQQVPLDEAGKELDTWSKEAWLIYLKNDMDILTTCDAIYMMQGWSKGNGTLVELGTARRFGLEIIFEDEDEALWANPKDFQSKV